MSKITTIGLDLAKHVFHVVCCDARGKMVMKKALRRGQVLDYFAKLERCRVGMEACAGAHAVTRPEMRFTVVKTSAQQDVQALHRLRERCVQARTALANQVRGLLAEYGLVLPKGVTTLRRRLPEILEDAGNGLSELPRRLVAESYRQLQALDAHIACYSDELKRHSAQSPACQRLTTIPGFDPIVASVFHSQVGHGEAYARGRDVAAALGLVPRQSSSGGKQRLLGISKRGDRYLRSLLIHGARAVVARAQNKEDRLSRRVNRLRAERGYNKAAVALANKMARMGWAVLHHKTVYQAA